MARTTDPVIRRRNQLVGLYRFGEPNPAAVAEAKRNLTIAHAERAIQKVLDADPPLTSEQRTRLAEMLVGGSK